MTTPVPAYGYLRVSSVGQTHGHGFDRQREVIEAHAAAAGFTVKGWFKDAHTGTEAERPAFEDMLTEILSNGVRTILVESLDRLARELMVQIRMLAELKSRGVTLISASTGQDVTADIEADPMREAMVQIQGVFNQLDKRLIVRKLAKARNARREETGRCEGRKPYGDRPGEADILARMARLRRKDRSTGRRMSYGAIADRLNREGAPTRMGKAWTAMTVARIIKRTHPGLAD